MPSRPTSPSETPAVLPGSEQAQLAALHDLGLASAKNRQFDEVSGKVAQTFDAPIALVSFVGEVHWPQQIPHEESLDAHVIAANEVLVSEDVTKDPRFADDPLVLEKGHSLLCRGSAADLGRTGYRRLVHHRHPTSHVPGIGLPTSSGDGRRVDEPD